jgi:hypothetical protein
MWQLTTSSATLISLLLRNVAISAFAAALTGAPTCAMLPRVTN